MLLDRGALAFVLVFSALGCAVAPADPPVTVATFVGVPDPATQTERDVALTKRSGLDDGPAALRTNALATWGFEPASADCNGWSASGATSIRAAPPHTGAYACKLCADGSAEQMTLSRRVGALEAGRYAVTAWVRRFGGSDDAPVAARVTLAKASTSADLDSSITLKDDWYALRDPLDIAWAVPSATVTIEANAAAPGQCILVDDVVVERTHAFLRAP
jgi:hypothetical protein